MSPIIKGRQGQPLPVANPLNPLPPARVDCSQHQYTTAFDIAGAGPEHSAQVWINAEGHFFRR